MKKVCILNDDGSLEEIKGFVGHNLKEIKNIKIKTAIDEYLDVYSSKKSKENFRNEKRSFSDFLKLTIDFKIEFMSEINSSIMNKYVSTLLAKMKPSSVNRRLSSFRHFFNICIDLFYIVESPMKKFKPLKVEKNHFKVWKDDQYFKFIELCDEDYSKYFNFLRVTGARPIEAQSLTWNDINWEKKEIYLRSKKNAKIKRTFPLTSDVEKIIIKIKPINIFVFTYNGNQIRTGNAYQYASHRLEKLGYDDLVPYGFRHTFASKLNQSDFNAFHIKDLLGHADIKTTLNYVANNNADLLKKINKLTF
jgi:integrase/recombinase XerC